MAPSSWPLHACCCAVPCLSSHAPATAASLNCSVRNDHSMFCCVYCLYSLYTSLLCSCCHIDMLRQLITLLQLVLTYNENTTQALWLLLAAAASQLPVAQHGQHSQQRLAAGDGGGGSAAGWAPSSRGEQLATHAAQGSAASKPEALCSMVAMTTVKQTLQQRT